MSALDHVHILLVEDDEEDAAIFRRYIARVRHHSATITHTRDGREALRLLEEHRFDLVCLDLHLGGHYSGLDVLQEARRIPSAPPIIIVTGSGDEEKAAETMRSGAADYLVKDRLSPEILDRTIRTVREKHTFECERFKLLLRLQELSVKDDLTGVANRRHLMAKLDEEIRRSERTGQIFSLLMVDLDHFKEINDQHGHGTGDRVLRASALALVESVRSTDFVGRYGGDEFCVLLLNTPPAGARRVAEKIQAAFRALPPPACTASIGIAHWRPGLTREGLLRSADVELYRAKQLGRDCASLSASA